MWLARVLFLVIFSSILFSAKPLSDPFVLLSSVKINAKAIATDRLGNAYIISENNELNKYSPDGKFLATQNIKVFGNLHSVDASNPLEIYLFYRDINQLVFLDNQLSRRGDINFNRSGILQASAAGRSFDDGIWVFDLADMQLKKLNKNMELQHQSGNLSGITDTLIAPVQIYDNGDRVFVNNPATGIMLFDIYGQYIKTIPVKGIQNFQVQENTISYFKNSRINSYDFKRYTDTSMVIPDTSGIVDARIEKHRFYILKKNELNLYAY